MDRNDSGNQDVGSTGGGAGFGNAGNTEGAQGYAAGSTANVGQGFSGSASGASGQPSQDGGLADKARSIAGSAQDKLADVGSTVRDRAGNLKNSLADALDTGADKLHQRAQGGVGGRLAGSTGTSGVAIQSDGRIAEVGDRVASGMHATADWLREADLDGLKTGIERQVRDHPGRSLLIAAGVGYLLGKAFRK